MGEQRGKRILEVISAPVVKAAAAMPEYWGIAPGWTEVQVAAWMRSDTQRD